MISKHRGFSLMEVLIVIVILGIGIVSLLGLQAQFTQETGLNYARDEAMRYGAAKLETLQSQAYLDYNLDPNNVLPDSGESQIAGQYATYKMTWSTTPEPFYANWNHIQLGIDSNITVTVIWIDTRGNTQTITLDSQMGMQEMSQARLLY